MLTEQFSLLGHLPCSIFSAASVVFMYVSIYTFVKSVSLRKPVFAATSLAALCGNFTLYHVSIDVFRRNNPPVRVTTGLLGPLPFWTVLFIASVFFTLTGVSLFLCRKSEKGRIGPNSIRDGIDCLPEGVCFYSANLVPRMVNRTMFNLCHELTGSDMVNGRYFENVIRNSENAVRVSDDTTIVRFPDGRCFSFTAKDVESEEYGVLRQIIAPDITKLDTTRRELERSNERLKELNDRVLEFGKTTVATTIQQEILNHKIKVHNNLGELLAKTSVALQSDDFDPDAMAATWKKDLKLFSDTAPEQEMDQYEVMKKAAADVGFGLVISGTLPEEPAVKKAVASAIHQCMTNTVFHAKGKNLFVNATENNGRLKVSFTNDGAPPTPDIVEGTGLKDIRKMTDDAGGIMNVSTVPVFRLELDFPRYGK